MKVTRTKLAGVLLIEPDVFGDDRGYFSNLGAAPLREIGVHESFVQTTCRCRAAASCAACICSIRMGKASWCPRARRLFDVAVDVRTGRRRSGSWSARLLRATTITRSTSRPVRTRLCVTSDVALFSGTSAPRRPPRDRLGSRGTTRISRSTGPIREPVVSEKESGFRSLADIPRTGRRLRLRRNDATSGAARRRDRSRRPCWAPRGRPSSIARASCTWTSACPRSNLTRATHRGVAPRRRHGRRQLLGWTNVDGVRSHEAGRRGSTVTVSACSRVAAHA